MKTFGKYLFLLSLSAFIISGCGGSSREVTRIDSKDVVDLSGKWNDTDSRLTAEAMISDALSRPFLNGSLSPNISTIASAIILLHFLVIGF